MSETVKIGGVELGGLSAREKKGIEVLASGGSLKDLRGLGDADIETIHAIGSNLFNQAKYEQAEPMFQFACLCSHNEPRYWTSLGNCRRMRKEYAGAIDALGFGHMLDSKNPWPVIDAAVCYLALGDKENAAGALTLAEMTVETGTPDEGAKKRIAALRQAL